MVDFDHKNENRGLKIRTIVKKIAFLIIFGFILDITEHFLYKKKEFLCNSFYNAYTQLVMAWAAKRPANEPLTGLFTGPLTAQFFRCFLLGR